MPDIKYAGGDEKFRRIAALAQTVGFEIAPHNPPDPIFCRWRCNSAKRSVSSA
jgi:L-alanine-DL-glutamate epimerase-like enolase superfamily enzyme